MAAPNIATLNISYSYKEVDSIGLNMPYSYTVSTPDTATLDIVYSYDMYKTANYSTVHGKWSDHTQRIVNRLPYWHTGRQGGNQTNYQKFVNIFGSHIEDLHYEVSNVRRNFYPSTADTFSPYESYRSDLQFNLEDRTKHRSSNLLRNSDFSIPGIARYQLPLWWSDLKTASTASVSTKDIDDGVVGGNAVTIRATAGTKGYLHQQVQEKVEPGEQLTLSAWINIPVHQDIADTDTEDSTVTSLYLAVLYVDGTIDHIRTALPVTTLGYWRRIYTTINISKPTYTVTAMVEVNVPSGDRTHVVLIDAMQLERGSIPTQWRNHDLDSPPWLDIQLNPLGGPLDVHILEQPGTDTVTINTKDVTLTTAQKRRLFFVDRTLDFLDDAIPTSIASMTDVSSNVPITFSTKKYGLYTEEVDKSSWPVLWRINPDDSTQIQRYTQGPKDILNSYPIAERSIGQDIGDTVFVTSDYYPTSHYIVEIKDFTIFRRKIWALCKETLNGTIFYTIKIIKTDVFPTPVLIEMIHDIALNSTDSATIDGLAPEVSFIGFVDGERDQLIIGNGTTYYKLQLNYDYYMLAETQGQILTTQSYTGALVMT